MLAAVRHEEAKGILAGTDGLSRVVGCADFWMVRPNCL
jgi:hypothetical protein